MLHLWRSIKTDSRRQLFLATASFISNELLDWRRLGSVGSLLACGRVGRWKSGFLLVVVATDVIPAFVLEV